MKETFTGARDKPHVSIGLPVFNGEKYLEEALNSILAQTYSDFELIISDNASIDDTQRICREYAAKDSRICYYRNERNVGASRNFNRVFELSSGDYFKWAAHDDVLAPEFLSRCVSVLDQDPSIVLCHSKTGRIDEEGALVDTYDYEMRIYSPKPHERFGSLISVYHPVWPIFGVIRASSLRMTPLMGNYNASDRNLLAEIGLIGRIYIVPEYLFFRRDHPQAYSKRVFSSFLEELAWWIEDGAISSPYWGIRFSLGFLKSVRRVPLKPSEQLLCYEKIGGWLIREGWKFIGNDVKNFLLSCFARGVPEDNIRKNREE